MDDDGNFSVGSKIAETALAGGRLTAGVVRAGDTVRRPQGSRSPSVDQWPLEFGVGGFSGAPRFIGVDDQQRETLSFLPGDVPKALGGFTGAPAATARRDLAHLLALGAIQRIGQLQGTRCWLAHAKVVRDVNINRRN